MSAMLTLGIIFKAYDQMTSPIRRVDGAVDGLRSRVDKLRDSAERMGRGALADGLIAGAGLKKTISAYADLEDSATRLKVTMMDKNGLTGAFDQINTMAIELGNKLPGTTADFQNMMSALKAQGISDESILGGVGKSAAYLGVLLKMMPDEAATFAAKMKVATGTADKDMLGLMDTIQRLNFMGVTSTEMMYAFARSAGALKVFKIQGLEASKALAPIYAMLIKGGLSGETVGTGFAAVLNDFADRKKLRKANAVLHGKGIKLTPFDKTGNLKSIRELVVELDKLKNLDPLRLNAALKELTGGGQDQQMLAQIITGGVKAYDKYVADMQRQAELTKRVNAQLGTLKNLWEAASGTFVNVLAAFTETFAPELKALTEWFNDLADSVFSFIKTHPTLAKWIGLATVGFVAVAIGLGAAGIAFAVMLRYAMLVAPVLSGIWRVALIFGRVAGAVGWIVRLLAVAIGKDLVVAFRALTIAIASNPIGALLTLLVLAAVWIILNWEKVKKWFWQFVDWFKAHVIKPLEGLMPSWMKNWLGGKTQIKLAPPANLGPPQKTIANGGHGHVSGKVEVVVRSDGSGAKATAKQVSGNMPINVHNGPYMAGAH